MVKTIFKVYMENGTLQIPVGIWGKNNVTQILVVLVKVLNYVGLNETGVIGSSSATGVASNSGPVYSTP